MVFAGVDAGSRSIKVVLIDDNYQIIASDITDQGVEQASIASRLFEKTLKKNRVRFNDVNIIIATGYGRDALSFADDTVTEITCHAVGVTNLIPEARTIIDIGGQDSKLIRIGKDRMVRDFVMNDRCAAGTGRFLEVVAEQLEMNIQQIGKFAEQADKPSKISSMCVVFAETEIIGLLASGENRENIIAGVQISIASRIATMAGSKIVEPIIFTGGVALIPGMESMLTSSLGHPVKTAKNPQMTGALGAAILASRL